MFLLPAPLIVQQIWGMFYLPESPKFLLDNGHVAEAKRVLRLTLTLDSDSDGARAGAGASDGGAACDLDAALDEMVRDLQRLDSSSSSSSHCHQPLPCGLMDDSEDHSEGSTMHHHYDYESNKAAIRRDGRVVAQEEDEGSSSSSRRRASPRHGHRTHIPTHPALNNGENKHKHKHPPQPKKSVLRREVERLTKPPASPSYTQLSDIILGDVDPEEQEEHEDEEADNHGEEELSQQQSSVKEEAAGGGGRGGRGSCACDLAAFWEYRALLLIILTLMVFQQFTGKAQAAHES